MQNDELPLLDDMEAPVEAAEPWKILVVDDDEEVHIVTRLALEEFRFENRPVQILSAESDAAARVLLRDTPDIALILLDVVMESDHAGLDLVDFVRERLHNRMVRIVLRTGQPGQAPPREVVQKYDIDDYRTKTELTFERLFVVVTTALRTYHLLSSMAAQQAHMAYLATHDDLTGLPNRALLQDRIHQTLLQLRRSGGLMALLFIDLDGFKFINDSYGHSLGDVLLQSVSERLRIGVREGDTVARLGGDEFVVMLRDIAGPADALKAAHEVLKSLLAPFEVQGRTLQLTASIGVSVHPQDGDSAELLLKHADVALYGAKQGGRNRVQIYRTELTANVKERVVLEGALRNALELGQFELHYQPRVEMCGGTISGVEALLRWHHPQLGTVSPARFIPLAEEVGLIVPIGEWVLQTACDQLKAWQAAGLKGLTMAVNISARQFHDQDIAALVRRTLAQAGLRPEELELEMTESAMISHSDQVIARLRELRAMGVSLSMDDFGTGYSSLSYLSRLPINILKIDRSFTSQLGRSSEAASITRAIIGLAHYLNMRTICEGVETGAQYAFLSDQGCDAIQGHYFSPALPPDDLLQRVMNLQN